MGAIKMHINVKNIIENSWAYAWLFGENNHKDEVGGVKLSVCDKLLMKHQFPNPRKTEIQKFLPNNQYQGIWVVAS